MTNIDKIPQLRRDLDDARRRANAAAVIAVRELERALRDALAGSTLRGLPNLSPVAREPFYAARLRTKPGHQHAVIRGLGTNMSRALCVGPDGKFIFAWWGDRKMMTQTLFDEDIKAEDIEIVPASLAVVIDFHLDASASATARYRELGELALTLAKVLR